jgi:hypothetical protein
VGSEASTGPIMDSVGARLAEVGEAVGVNASPRIPVLFKIRRRQGS